METRWRRRRHLSLAERRGADYARGSMQYEPAGPCPVEAGPRRPWPRLAPLVLVLVAPAAGCAPMSPLIPLHLTETTQVLEARKISFNAIAGVGVMAQEGWGPGGALRLRVGVGAKQEVGIEGATIYADTGEPKGGSPPWIGKTSTYGAKLSWKYAPLPWLAVLAGAGASVASTGAAAGGDLALVLSTDHALRGWLRPYGAVRGSFALPIGRDLDDRGGATAALILPGGLSFQVNRWVSLFLEFGGIVAWSSIGADPARYEEPAASASARRYFEPARHGGCYGAFGATFLLERNTDSAWFMKGLDHWR